MNQGKSGIKKSAILNLFFSFGLLAFGLVHKSKGFVLFCIIIIIININTLKNLYLQNEAAPVAAPTVRPAPIFIINY